MFVWTNAFGARRDQTIQLPVINNDAYTGRISMHTSIQPSASCRFCPPRTIRSVPTVLCFPERTCPKLDTSSWCSSSSSLAIFKRLEFLSAWKASLKKVLLQLLTRSYGKKRLVKPGVFVSFLSTYRRP